MNETEKKDEEFMRKALAEAQAAFDEDLWEPSSYVREESYQELTT